MLHRPTWRHLLIGLAALSGVIGGAVLILLFARVGALHGRTFPLYVTTGSARGVIRGTEVWLDGRKVGLVKAVTFRPPSVPENERLVIELDVLERARRHIRRDSRASIRSGGSILGSQVVYLSSGTAAASAVGARDTIHAVTQTDVAAATTNAALAMQQVPAIISNVKLLSAELQSTNGTVGALHVDGFGSGLAELHAAAARMMRGFSHGRGTFGEALRDTAVLRQQARFVMAGVDSMRLFLASDRTSYGRFRRDSTLLHAVNQLRDELATVQQRLDDSTGTVGRLRTDSALVRNVHADRAAMDSLFADLHKHPLRYIVF